MNPNGPSCGGYPRYDPPWLSIVDEAHIAEHERLEVTMPQLCCYFDDEPVRAS